MRKDKTDCLHTLDIGQPIPCICFAYIDGYMNLWCSSAFVYLLVYHPKAGLWMDSVCFFLLFLFYYYTLEVLCL